MVLKNSVKLQFISYIQKIKTSACRRQYDDARKLSTLNDLRPMDYAILNKDKTKLNENKTFF